MYELFYAIKTIRYITISLDHTLSRTVGEAIKERIRSFASDNAYNPSAIIDKIPYYFPVVQSIELQQFPQQRASITITAFKPIIRINDELLLLENKTIHATKYYALSSLMTLPKITMEPPIPLVLTSSVMTAIERCISEKVFDEYLFHIANEHEWYLSHSNDPSLMLCCNAISFSGDQLQIMYDHLKKQIQKKGSIKTKWVADIRFRDQIILASKKGG
jgi:hypothetical protein